CVEACVYGTLDFVGYPRFPAPVEFIAAVIAYYVHPVNIQTACLIMEGAEFTENIIKKSGMVNITSSVNSRERSGINTILHELNPLLTINVTIRDIKSKNVYSRVNSKATTQWRKTESANGVHLEGVASDNRSS